ncbi:sensor histidine kinase [Thalassovita mangrovi]|uniref:histidine kinase n=1 Tax=Thalassovita mangrovi TaxID=2692236 RepID=A0A6L8LIZ9_9RHOB|nr:cache domain-containing protein [Thalassovita mangrovi]MYM55924.1 sensor histidine kinase [Thalassovita mangrovi]
MRRLSYIVPVIAMLVIAISVFRGSYGYFRSGELARAEGRLSLYQSSVRAEFERFSHLSYVLSRDPFVIAAAAGGGTGTLNPRLKDFATRAGLDAIYQMDTKGLTIAASNYDEPNGFIGQNYAFRPYFAAAMSGEQARFYAIGATTGLPGYFIADPVRGAGGAVIGVIAIKIDLSGLEQSWRGSGEQVFLANEDGVVLLSSDPDWLYRALTPLSQDQRDRIVAARQFPDQALDPLDWQDLPGPRVRIAGAERLHLTAADLPHGWALHYFSSDDRAVARAWLVTTLVAMAAGLALIFYQIARARRVVAALARSEREEAELREANKRLAREIEDRRSAERRLKRTQDDLERASRLAALGQLAASVTHELGQPIAAMRNHLTAAEIGGRDAGGLTGKIGGLVDRMEGITRQLKFFARSESDAFDAVDLRDAMRASLALVEPNLAEINADLKVELPENPVMVRGNRLRIEQVMTNLLRNAVDSVDDSTDPQIWAQVGQTGGESWFEVRDNGHGLGQATLAELQEPFVTTRESGRGMGLGLAISAGIVKDHGAVMEARNGAGGGAVFRVTFPEDSPEDAPEDDTA